MLTDLKGKLATMRANETAQVKPKETPSPDTAPVQAESTVSEPAATAPAVPAEEPKVTDAPALETINSQLDMPESASAEEPDPSDAEPPKRFGANVVTLPDVSVYPYIQECTENSTIVGYNVFILGPIGSGGREYARALQDVVQILDHATEGMRINFYLNTPGGSVSAMSSMVSAMRRTKAHVHTVAVGSVMSAGTVIWWAGKTRDIYPGACFMYHFSSHGSYGNSSFIAQGAAALTQHVKEKLLDPMVDEGMLTEEELEMILRREDVFISANVMKSRMTDRIANTPKESEGA